MKKALVVIENFLSHLKGEVIEDAKLVEQYLKSEWQHHVVQIALPDDKPKK